MNKKLLALAVAAAVVPMAGAHAAATVYGVADASFESVKASAGTNVDGRTRISTNSSLLGFKFDEDLGDGLKMKGQFEGGVSFDSAGGYSFARDSFVGLAGGFGEFRLGNNSLPYRAIGAGVDVIPGATGIANYNAILGRIGGANLDTRATNSLVYMLPKMGPASVTLAYQTGENNVTGGAKSTAMGLGVVAPVGPVTVALAYESRSDYDVLTAAADTDTTGMRIRVTGQFGDTGVKFMYETNEVDGTGAANDHETTGFYLGATQKMGTGELRVFYVSGDDQDNAGVATANSAASQIGLSYGHMLSKTTQVYATYTKISNDSAVNFDFGVNGVGGVGNGADVTGFGVGVRTSF